MWEKEGESSQIKDETKLTIDSISLSFGGLRAITEVSLEIQGPGIYSMIGPNGAGKTCVINCVTGFYQPGSGKIYWKGKELTHMSPHKIAELGIARTFQNIALYTGLTVLNNIMAGRHTKIKYGILSGLSYFGSAQKEEAKNRDVVEEIIEFLEIEAIRKQVVGVLPYGLRKRVDLGRALALEPEILLLDEPMAGMNVEEKEEIARFVIDICELRKIPVVLIEHDMDVVMDMSDRIIVLDVGRKIAEGSPDEIRINPAVIRAYIGEQEEETQS